MIWLKTCRLAASCLLGVLAGAAPAATLVVGPVTGLPTVAMALQRASDGDTIELRPGVYRADVAVIRQKRLTLRGQNPRPVMMADGRHADGKAIWVVRGGDITIENIEFRGARVPDGNGAGIRFEQGQLTVRRCAFFDNEMGLLTSNDGAARLHVADSEFGHAPTHAGALHHLLYVGRIAHVTIERNRFHDGFLGHLIKSRARESVISGNTIVDGANGRASYEIDLPNGGLASVQGNTIGQSAQTDNPAMVSFGAEGEAWPESALTVEDNRLINDRPEGGTFVRVWRERLPPDTRVIIRRNRLTGRGSFEAGPGALLESNIEAPRP